MAVYHRVLLKLSGEALKTDYHLFDFDKVKETVGQIGGPKSARRFEAILDRLRRRMHASRANLARQREMRFMLGVSLVLALVIAGGILGYFLFIH